MKKLTKVYCRIRYADGSEGPGYTWIARDGWTIGPEGHGCEVKYMEDHVEVRVEDETFVAMIGYETWGRLDAPEVPSVLRCKWCDKVYDPDI